MDEMHIFLQGVTALPRLLPDGSKHHQCQAIHSEVHEYHTRKMQRGIRLLYRPQEVGK